MELIEQIIKNNPLLDDDQMRVILESVELRAQKEMLEKQITLLEDIGKDNIEIYELKLLLEDLIKND